jgi:hypothetical protein
VFSNFAVVVQVFALQNGARHERPMIVNLDRIATVRSVITRDCGNVFAICFKGGGELWFCPEDDANQEFVNAVGAERIASYLKSQEARRVAAELEMRSPIGA